MKLNNLKKFIFAPLLILNLAVFNFPVLSVLAEGEAAQGEETGGEALAEQVDVPSEVVENTAGDAGDSGEVVIDTGDVDIGIGVENNVNTNITEIEEPSELPVEEPIVPAEEVIEEIISEEPDLTFIIEPTEEELPAEEELPTEEELPLDENPDLTEDATPTEDVMPTEDATPTEETILTEEIPEECTCQEPSEPCEECQCECELEVENENEAEVENDVEVEADTGENIIEDNSGDSIINTGDVNIALGVINTVNTNITESEFSNSLLNIFEKLDGDINLEDQFDTEDSLSDNCQGENECLEVNNENKGEIENEILIDGSSGGNYAESTNGNSYIHTGDVNASANVFNLLNTNLVSSNWHNFIINIFADWTGDLVLPGKAKMQEFLDGSPESQGCGQNCGISIENTNEGEIENEVSIIADTGSNTAQGSATIIRTGKANAIAQVVNVANTNIVGGSWFFIAINNFGRWRGNLYSLPEELQVGGDPDSIKIYNVDADELGSKQDCSSAGGGALEVVNDNEGLIKNSVVINVSSGDNTAEAQNGGAAIETGNANVFANLVNVLNTNITGSNWLSGMVNIFGDWNGDIAFGRPDLLIAESAVTSADPVGPEGLITYTLNYFNNGDADATDVRIIDDFDEGLLSVFEPRGGHVIDNPGEIEWNIGNVPAGGSGSVSYTVKIGSNLAYGTTYVTNQSEIFSLEDDWNNEDNNDSLSVEIFRKPHNNEINTAELGYLPYLQLYKTAKQNVVKPGENVDYEIVLTNYVLGSAYEVVVEDVLYNESSEIINKNSWDLGEVRGYEKIIIDYTINIGEGIAPGFFTNVAKAYAWSGYDSNEASTTIEVSLTGISSLLETEEAESEEIVEPTSVESELSLEEIEELVLEINNNIKKIKEEIKRFIAEEPELEQEGLVGQISEMILPTVSAQSFAALGENEAVQDETRGEVGLDKFLAAVGSMPFSSKLILIILGLVVLVLILLWFYKRRKKEEKN